MTRAEAKRRYGVEFGSLTTRTDSVGECTLYEDGREVAADFCSAAQLKAEYILREVGNRIADDPEEAASLEDY